MKKIVVLGAIASLVLGIAACAGGGGGKSVVDSEAQQEQAAANSRPASTNQENTTTQGSDVDQGAETPSESPPKPKHHSACVGGRGYGGIGASVGSFKDQNTMDDHSSPYQDGIAYWDIKGRERGCVSDYAITERTTPTQSDRELMALVMGIGLPHDAQQLVNQNRCGVWKSAALKRATGKPYAAGYVIVEPVGDETGIVDMSISSSPEC